MEYGKHTYVKRTVLKGTGGKSGSSHCSLSIPHVARVVAVSLCIFQLKLKMISDSHVGLLQLHLLSPNILIVPY